MPRLRRPTVDEFQRFLVERTPVLIEGALAEWPALSSWTFDRLGALASDLTVRVQSRPKARPFFYKDVPFKEFVDSLRAEGTDYLASFPLFDRLPALLKDVEVPLYAGGFKVLPRVFIGPRGAHSPLHFDLAHGLSAQVMGTKRVACFEFRRRDLLKHPELCRPGWLSESFDVETLEYTGEGRLNPLRRWECTVEPGDLVFLPSRRHHLVRTLDAGISVSFFWHTPAMSAARWALGRLGHLVM